MRNMVIFLVLMVFVAGAYAVATRRSDIQAPIPAEIRQVALNTPEQVVPTDVPTATIEPTATTGYQATTDAAQATTVSALQTASAAIAQQVQATNDHEARQFSLVQMTQDADRATQTAAPTSIQLTGTQQAIDNILSARQVENVSGAMTATKEAPTQIAAAAKAESNAKVAPIRAAADAISPLCSGAAIIVIGALILMVLAKKYPNNVSQPEYDVNELDDIPVQPSAPVRLWEQKENTINRDTEPPGAPEKFRALITHAERGNLLGINSVTLAGAKVGLYGSNAEYAPVLEWLVKHDYVTTQASGGKVFSPAGEVFCNNWLQIHPYPTVGNVQNTPSSGHDHNNHAEGEEVA